MNVIKKEKNSYISKINNYFNKFLVNNLENLNDIISDLNILLSEEALFNIAKSFEISLNFSLEKLINITNENINLSKQYFDQYYKIISNESELINLLQNYYLDSNIIYRPYYNQNQIHQLPKYDIIYGKIRTLAYLSKYNNYIANFNYSEEYLSNQLYFDIINEYREIFSKIKNKRRITIYNK